MLSAKLQLKFSFLCTIVTQRQTDMFSPNVVSQSGYYCSGNSTLANPISEAFGDECPAGSYCPENSSHPVLCGKGIQLFIWCLSTIFDSECSTLKHWNQCKPCWSMPWNDAIRLPYYFLGTFNPGKGKSDPSSCLDCPPRYFCNGTGQTNVSGQQLLWCEPLCAFLFIFFFILFFFLTILVV